MQHADRGRPVGVGHGHYSRDRRLHDLSFPEASAYLDTSKAAINRRLDIERGHLEIQWQLYRPQAP